MPRASVKVAVARAAGHAARGAAPESDAGFSVPPANPASAVWEAAHRRLTFYCSHEMLAAIQAERSRSGRSKTQIINDALRRELGI
ncbi:MAG: ribbon-helix-helix domain-containing protein [Candidatus Dormibacteria bacterium]